MVLPLGKYRATAGPGAGRLSCISRPKFKAFLFESFSDLADFTECPLAHRAMGLANAERGGNRTGPSRVVETGPIGVS
jgi:hypothetical protein